MFLKLYTPKLVVSSNNMYNITDNSFDSICQMNPLVELSSPVNIINLLPAYSDRPKDCITMIGSVMVRETLRDYTENVDNLVKDFDKCHELSYQNVIDYTNMLISRYKNRQISYQTLKAVTTRLIEKLQKQSNKYIKEQFSDWQMNQQPKIQAPAKKETESKTQPEKQTSSQKSESRKRLLTDQKLNNILSKIVTLESPNINKYEAIKIINQSIIELIEAGYEKEIYFLLTNNPYTIKITDKEPRGHIFQANPKLSSGAAIYIGDETLNEVYTNINYNLKKDLQITKIIFDKIINKGLTFYANKLVLNNSVKITYAHFKPYLPHQSKKYEDAMKKFFDDAVKIDRILKAENLSQEDKKILEKFNKDIVSKVPDDYLFSYLPAPAKRISLRMVEMDIITNYHNNKSSISFGKGYIRRSIGTSLIQFQASASDKIRAVVSTFLYIKDLLNMSEAGTRHVDFRYYCYFFLPKAVCDTYIGEFYNELLREAEKKLINARPQPHTSHQII